MNCKDRILSNDYYDILTDFPLSFVEAANLDQCFVNIENLYSVVYLNRSVLSNTNEYFYDYRSVPKLYGLMQQEMTPYRFDPNSLIVSGITQVQREPLGLTGRGVVVCLIDTGERVINLHKAEKRCRIFMKSVIHLLLGVLCKYYLNSSCTNRTMSCPVLAGRLRNL